VNQSDLTVAQQEQLNEAKAWVDLQASTLVELRPAIEALVKCKDPNKLSRKHRQLITTHLRWGDEDYANFIEPPKIVNLVMDEDENILEEREVPEMSMEDRVERTFRAPEAYFYFDHDGKQVQVHVQHSWETGKQSVSIRDEDDPDFF
jgi:hypothetical protein